MSLFKLKVSPVMDPSEANRVELNSHKKKKVEGGGDRPLSPTFNDKVSFKLSNLSIKNQDVKS